MATYWENSCSFGLRYVSWYKYLVVGLVFSRLGFWSGNLFLIAPFPDLCLLVPFWNLGHRMSFYITTSNGKYKPKCNISAYHSVIHEALYFNIIEILHFVAFP